MKNILIPIAICIGLTSCQFIAGEVETVDSTATADNSLYDNQFLSTPDTSITEAIAFNGLFVDTAMISSYISTNKLSAADAKAIKGFYNTRNNQFAWFAADGMTEQGRAFWNAYTYAKAHGQKDSANIKGLKAKMDTIVEVDTLMVVANDSMYQRTELELTHSFINYYRNVDSSSLIRQLPLTYLLPVRKVDAMTMADSVLSYKVRFADDSVNSPYLALRKKLELYDSVAEKGGWQPITGPVGKLKKGVKSPAIAAIKKRLHLSGDYRSGDTSAVYSDSLDMAIRSFQQSRGLKADGIITDTMLVVMNVPVEQRIEQILINMNRMAWLPPQIKENFVAVNIPEFMLRVHEGDSIPIEMPVVVGKEGTNTMMFTGDMNQVVFNPTWRIPSSIVKDEILPAMKSDPNYLKKKNMEIVGKNDTLPDIRQLPGAGNALGQVKFLFPNSYDIYLHDTEAKELFSKNKRAFSHGCIRVADPQKLSEYVLQDNGWSAEKINAAMNGDKEQPVAVKKSIPVVITYFTSWVDDNGNVQFRDDIYSHDKRTAAMMFKATERVV